MSEAGDAGDIYRPPQAPPAPTVQRPWRRGLVLATVPPVVNAVVRPWLTGPGMWLVALFLWIGAVILTFYGVGVFLWSTKERPTWGRSVLVATVTGVWMGIVGFLTSFLVGVLGL